MCPFLWRRINIVAHNRSDNKAFTICVHETSPSMIYFTSESEALEHAITQSEKKMSFKIEMQKRIQADNKKRLDELSQLIKNNTAP